MTTILRSTVFGGRYVLTEIIASGGMGDVWRATDQRLRREVAVKVLRSEFARDEVTRQRFQVEAQAVASVTSSGIASVYDYGEEVGRDGNVQAYIVMELVHGESLEERLHREFRLGASETLDIIAQAAVALQDAHDCGLIHRDIKPANLLLRTDGVVKLTDFGIVRVLDSTSLTQAGTMVGTVRYMSPEQLTGQTASPASDIYALGIVAYFCVAGHPPFDYDESMAVAMAHVSDPMPAMPPDVPPAVAEFISQMLAKHPSQRPPTATEVALRAAAIQESVNVRTTRTDQKMSSTPVSARAGDTTRQTVGVPSVLTIESPPTMTDRPPTAVVPASVALDDPREKSHRHRPWMLVLTAMGVMAAAAAAVLWLEAGPIRVSVPRLSGLTTSTALARVDQLGLRADQRLVDVDQRAGRVVSQLPRQGTSVPSGSHVLLNIASGYVTVNAAALQGQPAANAAAALSSLGLMSVQTTAVSTTSPGTVLSISPTGRVRVGTSVVMTVAVAPPPPTTTTTTTTTTRGGGPPSRGKHGGGNDQ